MTQLTFDMYTRLEVLTRLALSNDEPTQEHAVETLAELMTIPAIQVRISRFVRF